jgi:molybdopterin synthase catalytic subunit
MARSTKAKKTMIQIRVQAEPFDPAAEQASLWSGRAQVGAVVSFLGLMRDMNEGEAVARMTLEHYPGMTEKALTAIAEEAARRWSLDGVRVLHRVGALAPQDPIVLVAVSSAHRGDAFRACEFLIDYLKTRAPFWKQETIPSGDRWVEARETDGAAAGRWGDVEGQAAYP